MSNEERVEPGAGEPAPAAGNEAGTGPETETQPSAEAGDEALRRELEEARSKAEEHWSHLLRAQAELENQRRRLERDVEHAHKYGLEKFARELLPVVDSLERGLEAANGEAPEVEALREGMDLTLKMLLQALEKFGVQPVEPRGEAFNPELHEAMGMRETEEVEPDHVVDVFQKGYLLNDRLLRPAMVMVAKGPAEGGD